MPVTQYFEKEITLSSPSEAAGLQFPARLAYWTLGDPANPAVFLPTCYGGRLANTSTFLYSDDSSNPKHAPFPSSKYFIIVVGLLSGSESSSPSNTPAPYHGAHFPHTTYADNIHLQRALCAHLGVTHLFAYIGFSMGGQQAYHMGVLYPDFVDHIVCIAGSARTSWHNWSFLEGPRYALTSALDFHDGHYTQHPARGVKAFNRVYVTWALSQAWFRQQCWVQAGYRTLEEYLDKHWSGKGEDANDLLALLWTWQHGDVAKLFPEDGGDLSTALGRVKAKALIMPSRTDQYFPPEDNEEEVKYLKHGEFRCIETVWGHVAGGGSGAAEDTEYMKKEIGRFVGLEGY